VAEARIKEGKSVVIDNTNPKKEDRKYYINLAKKYNYKVRCFNFLSSKDQCFHNDGQRVSNQVRKHFSGKVGKLPIHTFFKYYEKPTTDEGFYEVKDVNFIAKFDGEDDKKEYLKYTRIE
jgi:bifunctional polynucleotide phosphatase/kinase